MKFPTRRPKPLFGDTSNLPQPAIQRPLRLRAQSQSDSSESSSPVTRSVSRFSCADGDLTATTTSLLRRSFLQGARGDHELGTLRRASSAMTLGTPFDIPGPSTSIEGTKQSMAAAENGPVAAAARRPSEQFSSRRSASCFQLSGLLSSIEDSPPKNAAIDIHVPQLEATSVGRS